MARAVIKEIIECLENKNSFVLEAGAGAGKTYTLMQTIDYIQNNKKNPRILCITYTNVAKEEINKRSKFKNIEVNTLHEFLWGFIRQFQIELRKELESIVSEEIVQLKAKIEKDEAILQKPRKNTNIEKKSEEILSNKIKLEKYLKANIKKINYTGYKQIYKGNLGHDEIIELAISFFQKKDFVNLFLNEFDYIFIDEYQDTNLDLLDLILSSNSNYTANSDLVIGLFGDKMQQIYSNKPITFDWIELGLKIIEKKDNHRSNEIIIKANNILRADGFHQKCIDSTIPLNKIEFIINFHQTDEYLKEYLGTEYETYKRLYLTHKEIAKELGFFELSNIFSNHYHGNLVNEKLLKLEDRFLEFIINDIIKDIAAYLKGKEFPLINRYNQSIFKLIDLVDLNSTLKLALTNEKTLKEVLNVFTTYNLFNQRKYREICSYYEENGYQSFLEELLELRLDVYLKFNSFINKETPVETMAGVKGEEYNHVIVNVNSQVNWTKYNFSEFFLTGNTNTNSLMATHKLFYVCCTRAKSSLIINYIVNTPSDFDENKINELAINIKRLFGDLIATKKYAIDMIPLVSTAIV